jgi:hypothetical protein
MRAEYDPGMNRIDVAIRGLMSLRSNANWSVLARYGITLHEHDAQIRDALLEINTITTEEGVFELLRYCPFLLDAAIEMLLDYQTKFADSRRRYYEVAA